MATYQQVVKRFAKEYMKKIKTVDDREWLRDNSYTLWVDNLFIERYRIAMQSVSNRKNLDSLFEIALKEGRNETIESFYNDLMDKELEKQLSL